MNTKRSILTLTIALFFITALCAQPTGGHADKREQIESIKIGYLTKKLSLTTEEAQVFWPVYNAYRATVKELRMEKHEKQKAYKGSYSERSEKELTQMVDDKIIFQQRELDIQKKYHAEFKNVLSIEKLALLYKAEDDFKKYLLKEAQKRQQPQQHSR